MKQKSIFDLFKDPKVVVILLGFVGTVSGVVWNGVQAQAELKVKKEYDKVLTDYAIKLATCR